MNPIHVNILISVAVFLVAILVRHLILKAIAKVRVTYDMNEDREGLIKKLFNIGIAILVILVLLGVWEIETEDLGIYFASIFTVIGVAFFAQWSHLSNVTGSIILYFAHSIKIGDHIEILDKEAPIKGIIKDINLFFIIIRSSDGHMFTLSNTLFLQKIVGYKLKKSNHVI